MLIGFGVANRFGVIWKAEVRNIMPWEFVKRAEKEALYFLIRDVKSVEGNTHDEIFHVELLSDNETWSTPILTICKA